MEVSAIQTESEEDNLSLPSRIDSIWAPRSWKASLKSPMSRCSVDRSRGNWSFSDHFPVTCAVSFHSVFGASSKTVRCLTRRAHIGKLDIRHLTGEKLADFREVLTSREKAAQLRADVAKWVGCECHRPEPLPEPPPQCRYKCTPLANDLGGQKPAPLLFCLCQRWGPLAM